MKYILEHTVKVTRVVQVLMLMRVSVLAVTLMVMTELFHRFSECFRADAKIVPRISPQMLPHNDLAYHAALLSLSYW